ncbi:lamin tail domain-containing protein [Winogradskyella bathintestinalis]|uniref:Lamin tail domain-containing protein n=1 Tax=Winogradskyella bathintestinalis TaxID=3035208 RepID=A0ABT7ZST5_9FLAO|nr:lamin tail domain-containing protein [Winogradskyella bathintestinalis]MDN3492037.1 lamin tail domain-containing protein [Winogradskyella bathintestinalis]
MKHFYTLLLLLLIGNFGFGQTIIAYQGFEQNTSDTWATTFSTPACTSGSDRWDYSAVLNDINPSAGSQFWGIADLNGNCGSSSGESITFSDISVSDYTSISIKFDYEIIAFDNGDDLYYTVILDGLYQSEIKLVDGSSNYSTNGYLTQTLSIPDGTNSVGLEIRVTQNGGDYAGLDNFMLEGIAAPTCTAPTTAATTFSASSVTTNSSTLSWTRGNGDNVIVIMKAGATVDFTPISGTDYTDEAAFASGTELGTGNYVVYNGSGTSVDVTGLTQNETYHVAVYEYNDTDTCYMSTALIGDFDTLASTKVQFSSTSASVPESAGTYDLVIEIANEDIAATTFDVVLTSGDAVDIDSYTTQSETFPGSSTTDVTVTITVTDDAIIEPDEVFTFEIQNVAGGNSAAVGTNNAFDLTITNNDFPTTVEFVSSFASVSEDVGTYGLEFTIINEVATATSFDVVLIGGDGDAADINGYTTQTVTFLSGSAINQIVTLTVTDDALLEANETLTFEIQSIIGGSSAVSGSNSTFTLTITNNDVAPPITLPYNEDFSNCGTAEWTPFDEAGNDEWICSGGEYAINGFPGSDDTDWLISNFSIDFDTYESVNIDVTTRERYGNATNTPGEFELLYSTDYTGGDPTTATWTALSFDPNNTSSSGSLSTASVTSVDASSITGTAYLAFKYDMNFGGGAEDWRLQNIDIYNALDIDTEVFAPSTQIELLTPIIAADVTTSGTAEDAFGFVIQDQGTADNAPTNVTTMRFVPGPNNTADWTDHIQGITLYDDNLIDYTPTTTITDSEIILEFDIPISITDGASLEFVLGIYLNTTDIVDGSIIQLQIEESASGFETDLTGSGLADPFLLGDVVGNNITIDVDATALVFSEQASDTELNAIMSPAVTVSGVDANGNLDIDYNLDVDITSTGTLTGSPVTETAIDGIATFSSLAHTVVGSGLVLTAADDVYPNITSTSFNITAPSFGATDLFFSEYVEGSNIGNNKYLEIYNGTGTIITLSDYSVELYSDGSSSPTQTENFTDNVFPASLANGDVIVLQAQNTSQFNGTAYNSNVCFFNGNDTVVLKKNGVVIDIIGNIGCDPGDAFTATGGYSTENQTIVRNTAVCEGVSIDPSGCGSTSFTTLATEWTTLGTDDFSNLGSHTSNCVTTPLNYVYNTLGGWTPADPSGIARVIDNITIETGTTSITSPTSTNNLIIEFGAILDIANANSIITSGGLVNNGLLRLESTSEEYPSLITNAVSGVGLTTYSRHVNTNASSGGNDLISAPLTGQLFTTFAATNLNIVDNGLLSLTELKYLFGPFEKPANTYVTYGVDPLLQFATLDPAVGYRAASTDDGNFTFTGTINTGEVPITITSEGLTFPEWNLIGNPYPSYINLAEFLAENNTLFTDDKGGVYGYNGNATDGWEIWNQAYSDNNPNALITPGQGFLVASKFASREVTFTPAMRTIGSTDDFIAGRQNIETSISYLRLQATNSTKTYNTDFYFNDTATLGLNPGYDSGIFGSAGDFSLYSHLVEDNTGVAMGIQTINNASLNTEVSIPLGVHALQGQQVTFNIAESTLPNTVLVYLEDTVTNTFTLLNSEDYTLTPNTDLSGTGRFYLRFSETTLSTASRTLNSLHIYNNLSDKTVVVAGKLEDSTTAKIYDLQGRIVSSTVLDSATNVHTISVSHLNAGVYIVQLANTTQNKSQKIILD